MSVADLPLVSCIMPTYNRRAFVPHAVRYFLQQDYPNKELVIIDDGTDCISDLVPQHPGIRYKYLPQKITLGAKLNMACQYAQGTIIANWDDDDWYAPWRLGYQVAALMNEKKHVCGINQLLYLDLDSKRTFEYRYPSGQRPWLLGSSLCYWKKAWLRNQFADINVGMDGLFVWNMKAEEIGALENNRFAVHMIHPSNISPKDVSGAWWHPNNREEIQGLMQDDWQFYANGKITYPEIKIRPLHDLSGRKKQHTAKNIFACLVHEKKECIWDMIRNLQYHDPDSIILLYNGGAGSLPLDQCDFPRGSNVVIYPEPVAMKHGYLHHFALDCFQYAADHFDSSFITIVDSDQLCIRSGYTDYISKYLALLPEAGMLSSNPVRVERFNKTNYVAGLAFNEYELWKPLLKQFPGGEQCFAHWTFWPCTVFTMKAVRALLQLFKENTLLQKIMQQTRIWATEEVILPTLIRLLGYEIHPNPCSYELVRYRQQVNRIELLKALKNDKIYWLHPVPRLFNDAIRKTIREKCNCYIKETNHSIMKKTVLPKGFQTKRLFSKVQQIEGWFSEEEAKLFVDCCAELFPALKEPHNIVEVGSYHGKSTVLLGSLLKALSPAGKLTAIDPHNGKVGAADQVLHKVAPSYEAFIKNIKEAKLESVVNVIRDFSYNVQWDAPISLLFIDGLHDYRNALRDYKQFADWVVPGGLVAFHDYADYYPGIKKLVQELLGKGTYQQVGMAGTLVVLQKI
ncbi:MAG TPA: class I SAM-dependent methyltransferase [Niabella sp.]